MATVQLRNPTEGRAYFDHRKAAGKTSMEAMRAPKRRLSDIIYRFMINDAVAGQNPSLDRPRSFMDDTEGPRPDVCTRVFTFVAGIGPALTFVRAS